MSFISKQRSSLIQHKQQAACATVKDAEVFDLPVEIQGAILEQCDLSQLVCLFQRNYLDMRACHEIKRAARESELSIASNLRELSNPKILAVIQHLYAETK